MPDKSQVIVLIGPMGVGKTTVGRKLAKILELPFTDTDNLITDEHGSISEIFESRGESAFREIEEIAVKKALSQPGIVATGGGAVLSERNQAELGKATVIYLSTDGKHMGSRLRNGNRPLLKNGLSDWRRIYDSRRSTYEKLADIEVNTSGQPLAATIAEIREKLDIND
ncbi:shikimate kinase [Rhodoluna limnophila]|uniref:shikimate kinase n=1 Tax=Rhodoluna limnophila TaxID=232537 RepID=UPI0011072938|nr:shikimate kinase [Rhodoluna limnophila]